jgi:hypothetical protein
LSLIDFDPKSEIQLYGALHPADLVMIRGAGQHDIDWQSEEEKKKYRELYICEEHVEELFTDWDHVRKYKHIEKNKAKQKQCSMPTEVANAHAAPAKRPIWNRYGTIDKQESRALLQRFHILVHPGLRKMKQLFQSFFQRSVTFMINSQLEHQDNLLCKTLETPISYYLVKKLFQ